MRTEDRDAPEIIGRLRGHAETKLDMQRSSRFARPIGWLIAFAIVVGIVYVAITANPW